MYGPQIAEENERRKARAEKYGTEFREVDGAAKAMFLEQRKEINLPVVLARPVSRARETTRPEMRHIFLY